MIQPILLTIALCSVIFFFVKEVKRLADDIREHYKDADE
jgi:phage gp36-like protein